MPNGRLTNNRTSNSALYRDLRVSPGAAYFPAPVDREQALDVARGAVTAPFTLAPDVIGMAQQGYGWLDERARGAAEGLGLPYVSSTLTDLPLMSGDPIREAVGLDPESGAGMLGEMLDPTAAVAKGGKLLASYGPDMARYIGDPALAINMFAVDSPQFRNLFSNSKLVDDAGRPDVLFHGSTGDIERFDLELANPESDWGRGIYLTNSVDDVNANYAGFGPDLTNRLQLEVERLEQAVEYDDEVREAVERTLGKSVDDADSVELDKALRREARQRFESTNEGQVTPLFAAVENPVVVGGRGETVLDIEMPYDEAIDEYGEETGSLVDFIEAIRDRADNYDEFDADQFIGDVYERAIDYGEISAREIHDLTKTSEGILYATDDSGRLVSKEIVRQAFEDIGYDGIIDRTVNEKFGTTSDMVQYGNNMAGVDEDTVHVIVFDPDKLNTAIGRGGLYEAEDLRKGRLAE